MLNCLKPVPLAVSALSNHAANLLASVGIFKFLFSNLEKQNSSLSRMLLNETRNELLEHRNKDLVFLIKHLRDVCCLHGVEKDDRFALANNNEIARLANH
jgi:hypothetical protein